MMTQMLSLKSCLQPSHNVVNTCIEVLHVNRRRIGWQLVLAVGPTSIIIGHRDTELASWSRAFVKRVKSFVHVSVFYVYIGYVMACRSITVVKSTILTTFKVWLICFKGG
jgi:hypothetical protein